MDILDQPLRSYQEEIVEGGEIALDRARCHPHVESFQRPPVVDLESLVAMHLGNPSQEADDEEANDMEENDEEEEDKEEDGMRRLG